MIEIKSYLSIIDFDISPPKKCSKSADDYSSRPPQDSRYPKRGPCQRKLFERGSFEVPFIPGRRQQQQQEAMPHTQRGQISPDGEKSNKGDFEIAFDTSIR